MPTDRLPQGESSDARLALQTAALAAAGELGFRQLSVDAILRRSGVGLARFYVEFADRDECYQSAYATILGALVDDVLAAGARGGDWPTGFRQALQAFDRFLNAQTSIAKGLLVEVHVAGGDAVAKRAATFERLATLIDRARERRAALDQSPPAITAAFALNAVEGAAIRALASGRPDSFGSLIPNLTSMVVSFYFGDEVALEIEGDEPD